MVGGNVGIKKRAGQHGLSGGAGTQNVIAILVVTGFFLVLGLLFVGAVTIPDNISPAVLVLIGTLGAKFGTVVDFYHGSSKGSQDKDAVISGSPSPAAKDKKDDRGE